MPRRTDDDFQPLVNASLNTFFRLSLSAQLGVVVLLLIAGLVSYLFLSQRQHAPVGSDGRNSPNLVLGNPSDATPDAANRDNLLMVKPYYVLSYNESKGTPNWVSWTVTESDLGDAPRKDEFDEDLTLPADIFHVNSRDYSGSGFDRGHMCPHSDRAANIDMSYATFVMTNIIPQAPNVNRKAWAEMEDYCRELVRHHDRLYIVAGPVVQGGQGGVGSKGERKTIGEGRVVVPSACWKLVVDVPDQGDATQITSDARVLTVEMPNDNDAVDETWAQYRTTPARVESETGLHFFSNLNPQLADQLRQRLDRMPLPRPRPLVHSSHP
jgi:endonuclease G, mitochondrial